MGNVAASARDVALFYHLLAHGKLVNDSSLAQMQDYRKMTPALDGFGAGGYYGLGLLRTPAPVQRDVTGAIVNWTQNWGHLGIDWGSQMTMVGYYPNLNSSMVLATNGVQSMNFTTGVSMSSLATTPWVLQCELANAVLQFRHPGAPALRCGYGV